MKLSVSTPLATVITDEDILQLRAEDATGSFGLLARHADFLTVLTACVLSWRRPDGTERHLAVRGGMLEVRGGQTVSVATREAIVGEDLEDLQRRVIGQFRQQAEQERTAHADAQKLYVAAIRQICRLLRSEAAPRAPGTGP